MSIHPVNLFLIAIGFFSSVVGSAEFTSTETEESRKKYDEQKILWDDASLRRTRDKYNAIFYFCS